MAAPMLDPTPDAAPPAWRRPAAWGPRRWAGAAVAGVLTMLAIGLPTDVIPNPVFGRPVPVTWWSLPVLVLTSVLAGLLAATYVREPSVESAELDPPARAGGVGGLLAFFAIGCPVCNKVVLLALGTTGALELFAPVQPLLAVLSVVVLALALRARLRNETSCAVSA